MKIKLRKFNGVTYLRIPRNLMKDLTIGHFVDLDPETLKITPITDDVEILEQAEKFLNNEKLFKKDEQGIILVPNLITCFKSYKYFYENEKFIHDVLLLKYPMYYSAEFKQWYIKGYGYAVGYEHAKKEINIDE